MGFGYFFLLFFVLRFINVPSKQWTVVVYGVHDIKTDKSNLKRAQKTGIAVYSVNRRLNSFSFIPSTHTKVSGDDQRKPIFEQSAPAQLFAFGNIHARSRYIIAPANIAQAEFLFHSVNKKHYTNQYTPARSSGSPEMSCG